MFHLATLLSRSARPVALRPRLTTGLLFSNGCRWHPKRPSTDSTWLPAGIASVERDSCQNDERQDADSPNWQPRCHRPAGP